MSSRRFWLLLGVITAVGAAWRLLYLFVVKIDDPLRLNDSLYYSIQAARNGEGDWFRENLTSLPGAEHGPLTPLYLTPWSLLPGDLVAWQRFAITLVGIANVPVVGVVGWRLAGARVGLAAGGIAALYPNLWIHDSLVMSEALAILLVAGALAIGLELGRRPTLGRAVLVGVLVGLGALARSEIALLTVGFAIVAWARSAGHPRRVLMPVVLIIAAGVTVAPWVTYNLARFERPVLMTTNGETTLMGANCDSTYYDDVGSWDLGCLQLPNEPTGTDASVRGAFRREAAFDYIGSHWSRLPIVMVARVARTLDVYGLNTLVFLDVGEDKARWAVWAGIASWWVLAPLAAVGWWRAGRNAELRRDRWWLAVPVIAVLVTSALFYGAHRIRAPAEPVVIVLAALALVSIVDRRRRGAAGGGRADADHGVSVDDHARAAPAR